MTENKLEIEDKYVVHYPDGTADCINVDLAKKQGLTDEDLIKIKVYWINRWTIETLMEGLDPEVESNLHSLKTLFEKWRENEFELQEVWGFPRSADYHRDFDLPHCTCPKLDNEDYLGTGYRVVTAGCIYHGPQKEEK